MIIRTIDWSRWPRNDFNSVVDWLPILISWFTIIYGMSMNRHGHAETESQSEGCELISTWEIGIIAFSFSYELARARQTHVFTKTISKTYWLQLNRSDFSCPFSGGWGTHLELAFIANWKSMKSTKWPTVCAVTKTPGNSFNYGTKNWRKSRRVCCV